MKTKQVLHCCLWVFVGWLAGAFMALSITLTAEGHEFAPCIVLAAIWLWLLALVAYVALSESEGK